MPSYDETLAPLERSADAVTAVDHIGLVVRDLDVAAGFYESALGMEREGGPVELEGRATSVQFLRGGSARVELLMPTGEGPLERFLASRGEGLHHVCYAIGDIHHAVGRLVAGEVRMIDAEPWRSPHGWVAYIHPAAAHGCAIELREHYR